MAIEHAYILVLEMFFWNKPLGLKTFNLTQELADATTVLAANQGLYNGFLAAGLFWGLFTGNRLFKIFFLVCVIVAGVFGAATAVPKIFYAGTARHHCAGTGAGPGQAPGTHGLSVCSLPEAARRPCVGGPFCHGAVAQAPWAA